MNEIVKIVSEHFGKEIKYIDETVEEIISAANKLAGEQFDLTTAITALSGGQSRALMIADTAILSSSPIVLIDEIENAGIDRKNRTKTVSLIYRQIADLKNQGHDVLVVSSGAISAGMGYLNYSKRPKTLPEKQACAAIGQGKLLHLYEKLFCEYGYSVGQILLTKEDFADVEEKVMRAAYEVINRKRATYYAIGIALFTIVKAILRDENVELAVSGYCEGHYGVEGIYIGTPAIIGREGVREVIELDLTEEETAKMQHSAKVLKETLEKFYVSEEREVFSYIMEKVLLDIVYYVKLEKPYIEQILADFFDRVKHEVRIESFKRILNYYVEEYEEDEDISICSRVIMEKIHEYLKDPHKNSPKWQWGDFSEAQIEIMRIWLVSADLEKYFSIEVNDKVRLQFWRRYIKYIKEVRYFERLKQAIVMLTDEHIFIEFGEKGNAAYCYKKDYISFSEINNLSTNFRLKNRASAEFFMSHSGNWEVKLKSTLYRLGYSVKVWR